jgi:hypothetical protein
MATIPAGKFIAELGGTATPDAKPVFSPGPFGMRSVTATAGNQASGEDAYERGVAAGHAAALADIETRLEEERTYYAQQLSLERFAWAHKEADRLKEQIAAGLEEVKTDLAEVTARILKPFLTEFAYRQAVEELLEALETLIGKHQGITLEISGPEDLLQLIREKLAGSNVAVLFSPGNEMDVRVVAGQTILETNLGMWMDRLRRE